MAFTVSQVTQIQDVCIGNLKMRRIIVTADSAEGTIDTGMGSIVGFFNTHRSCVAKTTLSANIAIGWVIFPNQGSTSTALAGRIGISNAVSGDVCDITVFATDRTS